MATPATEMTQPTLAPGRRAPAQRALPVVTPRVDIYETDSGYVLLADMPGVKAQGLEVVAERNELSIRGRVEPSATDHDYKEFELADYERSFVLTEDLETSKVSATLRDGVLRVEIPKSERVQPRKIPVKVE
jgi:HSP20 family protein